MYNAFQLHFVLMWCISKRSCPLSGWLYIVYMLLGNTGKSSWFNSQQQCCTSMRSSYWDYCLSCWV